MNDIVLNILHQMLSASPEQSYKRLNPALRSTLTNCIEADLPFQKNTFRSIYNQLRGSWWFGDGAGSHVGEHFYTQACQCNHASAYQSFEEFAGRPGVLWEEDSKTPLRLHVGARFTWQGYFVEVTSMRSESLVACTYKDTRDSVKGIAVGATAGDYDSPYVITATKREGSATWLRVIRSKRSDGNRDVARRFTIRYDEIAEFRRTEKERLKKILTLIAECDPAKDRDNLTKAIAAEHFRHFQLEELNAAFARRKDWVAQQSRVDDWRKGKEGAWLDTKEIFLRVRDDLVECSNGNRVSLTAVRRVLPIVLDRRNQRGTVNLPLDHYTIQSTTDKGVKVGCTIVPWAEIELLAEQLKQAA